MDDLLISLLETLEYDVIKQGTLDTEEYTPSAFFTYWNWQSPRDAYYDNKNHEAIYYYQIQFYSDDISIVESVLDEAIDLLEANGFELEEEPTDGYSDIQNYTSKTFDVHISKQRRK